MPCPECDGVGTQERCISTATFDLHGYNYEELVELRKDARRAINHAAKLTELNPTCAESYRRQLHETLRRIEREADELLPGSLESMRGGRKVDESAVCRR